MGEPSQFRSAGDAPFFPEDSADQRVTADGRRHPGGTGLRRWAYPLPPVGAGLLRRIHSKNKGRPKGDTEPRPISRPGSPECRLWRRLLVRLLLRLAALLLYLEPLVALRRGNAPPERKPRGVKLAGKSGLW